MFPLKLFQLLPRSGVLSKTVIRFASSKKGKRRGMDGTKVGETKVAMSVPAKSLNESSGENPSTVSLLDPPLPIHESQYVSLGVESLEEAEFRNWILAHVLQLILDKSKKVNTDMRRAADVLLGYILHNIDEGDGDISDLREFMSFVLALPEEFYGEEVIIIDGLNRRDLLKRVDQLDLSHPIIVVGRENGKFPPNFQCAIDEGKGRIKYLHLSAKKGEMDDICAMYLTLLTGGRLCTKDTIANHFKINYNKDRPFDLGPYFIRCPPENCASGDTWDAQSFFRFVF